MKTLDELQKMNRDDRVTGIPGKKVIAVGMATCGIASGARPVLNALASEVQQRGLTTVTVTQTGCIGLCQYEPIVEVFEPGKEKVTYVKMDPEKAVEVVDKHLCKGFVVSKYTLSSTNL